MNYDEDEVLCDSIVGRSYYFTKIYHHQDGGLYKKQIIRISPKSNRPVVQYPSKMCHFSSNHPIGSQTWVIGGGMKMPKCNWFFASFGCWHRAHYMQCGLDTNTKSHRNTFAGSHKYWIYVCMQACQTNCMRQDWKEFCATFLTWKRGVGSIPQCVDQFNPVYWVFPIIDSDMQT